MWIPVYQSSVRNANAGRQIDFMGSIGGLGEKVVDDFAMDVGEAEVAALGAEGEAFVVDAE